MKTLLLLRHAKSSWDDETLPDHDRPLNKRGIKAALRIGRLIRDKSIVPSLVLCSTAVRARETVRLVMKDAGIAPAIEYSEKLYHCPPEEFSNTLQRLTEPNPVVMLVGHNPGLEEFLNHLTTSNESFPTAALAHVEVDLANWSQFSQDTPARLIELWRPKELDV